VDDGLTLQLHICEVLGLNLGPETGYPNCFSWFSSVYAGKRRNGDSNHATGAPFPIVSNSSFTYHNFIRRDII
jgi:hypothetical protein